MIRDKALLSRLPEGEARFLIDESLKIARKVDENSLEGVLSEVGNVLNDKDYGWEEAILDGKWYRYPSEVKDQIFCSEQALKNYLLLASLGIHSRYLVAEGWTGRLAHELVVIPDKEGLVGLDWGETFPVKIEDGKLINRETKKILSKKVHEINQDEVLMRVTGLRTGDRFLDAIKSGQQLYRRNTDEGYIDAFVNYDSEKKEVAFEWEWIDVSKLIPAYFKYSMSPLNGKLHVSQELGLKPEDQKIPMIIADRNRKLRNDKSGVGGFRFFYERLNQTAQEEILNGILYDKFVADMDRKDLAVEEEDREKLMRAFVGMAEQDLGDGMQEMARSHLEIYNGLKEDVSERAAHRFHDFRAFAIQLASVYGDAKKAFEAHIEGRLPRAAEAIYTPLVIQGLGRILSVPNTLLCQQYLSEKLADRTNIPYTMPDSGFLRLTQEWGEDGRGSHWESNDK